MKNLLHTLSFMLLTLIAIHTRANTYYVSPSGSDSNPGTITSPFKTWQKLSSVLKAGDIGYIRGGTYTSPLSPGANDWIVTWQNLTGTSSNPIVISAYPGEQPVLDFSGFSQSNNITAIRVNNCSWIHFYGLRVVNLLQNSNGNLIAGWEMHDCTNITLEFCSVDNIGGAGFRNTTGCNNFTYINCDASRCADAINTGGGSYGNADGFDANAGATTYIGCRAWWDSDDGFDCFNNDSHIYYKNCWSFRNGYRPGTYSDPGSQADGMGFKWGSTSTDQSANVLRTYTNCIAFQNKVWGFDQNVARCKAEFYNNTSYNNKAGGWATGYGITPREASILKNNISFSESVPVSDMSGLVNDHNTWNNLNASSASFALLDTSGVTKPRQSDGSLPVLQYLHLSANSNMINAGVSVASLQFSGSAPDLGAFEYSGSSPVNQPPVANAGSNQTFFLPTNAATLSGSGTDADGTITGYQWTKISGPAQFTISSPTLAKTNVSNLVEGEYQFELKVTDNSGATAKDTVSVTVNQNSNQSPIAKAGNSQSIVLPTSSVSVDGSNSTDPDGTIASYQWTKILGPASAVITNSNLAITNITSLVQGVYQFELKVTDNLGAVGKDTVQITVGGAPNQPPVANAGLDINITLPTNNVTLSGSGTDADGTVASDQWIKISGPSQYTLLSPGQPQTSVNNLVQGTYAFELKVTDNAGASDRDTVQIIVNPSPTPNQAPTANAGPDINITLPTNSVTLSGSGSDGDGTIASYQWDKISGPSQYTISSPTQRSTSVNNLVAGIYQFQLTVADNSGATGVDIVQVTVVAPNQIPNADAGADINITLPTNSVTLSGSGSDGDGTIASYQWNKVSGPSQYTISSPTQSSTSVNNLVAGIYQFQLTVTDNSGATDVDVVQITVAAPNQIPNADAGADINITLPTNSVTLSGSGSDGDGTIASYQWNKVSGPSQYTISSPTQSSTSVNNLIAGIYQFQLTVTDNSGATDVDVVQITVVAPNQIPNADAGADINITLPTNSATLSGSGNDPDGNIVSYQWTKISGPAQYTIAFPTRTRTTINNLTEGIYTFQLQVTDNAGAVGTDIVQVTVNAAPQQPNQSPTANAGPDLSITLPTNNVTLNGNGSDPDGSIASYQWTMTSGPSQYDIASATQARTSINNLAEGVYEFQLQVTDNSGATAVDVVQITVNAAAPPPNQSPSADAGADIIITLPTNSTTLSGNGTDLDGTIASYQWNEISGPSQYTIVSPGTSQTTVDGLTQGVYAFELTVTDNSGAIAKDIVQITVNAAAPPPNQPPSANAGADIVITLPTNSTTLSGSGTDPDGWASYQWRRISGPSQYNIASPNSVQTSVNNLTQGVYAFELMATDNNGATAKDTVQITVNAAPNQSPVADAGTDINITLPTNSITLSGSGIDPDGTIASYRWTKIGGPAQYTMVSSSVAKTSVTNLVQGSYSFEFTVTDNAGASAKDTIEVTVTAAAAKPNQIPEANAGQDIQITLPTNSTRLSGSGTDPDGRIASYRWRSVSGPKEFTINSPTRTSTTIGNLIKGTYQFELTVTDNSGATDKDTVQVSVLAAPPNLLPIANAGADINLTLPTNSTTLSGSGSDPDGTVSSYQWRRISGPSQYNIVSSTKAQTTVNNLVQGTYKFELTVTDNAGASSKDTMQVIVNAAAALINQSPAANAGSDISITLPTNSTTLSGTGSDPDGTIASYQWRKISGPSQYNIVSSSKAKTTVNNLVQGVYQFEFTVTDNSGKNAKDTVQVTVNTQVSSASSSAAAPNQAPTANAGLDINITLPTNSVILKGTGTDVDGTIASYQWNKISGPSQYNIVSATQAQTTVNNLVDGIYKFELIVSDNSGAGAKDTVQVIVNPASLSANHSPTADAGSDLEITLPTDSIELSGKGSDMDGTVSSYKWSKVSGPAQYNIVSSSKAKTTVNNLVQGVYQFELTVTDNSNGSGKSTIQVTVYAAPNQLPTAKAGSDLQISLPTDTTTLTGAGTDPDGTIASYKWTKISGPVQSTVVSPSKSQTLISNLTEGVYQFELTVTDNSGASAKDTVGVIVLAVPKAFAKVFPNPATSVINIQIEGATRTSNTALRIYDNKGNLVYQEDFVRSPQPMIKQVNVSKLPSGIYFAELQTETSSITTLRFMKK